MIFQHEVVHTLLIISLCAACGQDDPVSATDGAGSTSGESSAGTIDAPTTTDAPSTTDASATTDARTTSSTDADSSASETGMECEKVTLFPDEDMDSFGDPDAPTVVCVGAGGPLVPDSSDCDDADANVHPGASEVLCDGVDHDCSGAWKTEVPSICPTIQAAVDVAPPGSTICVLPGEYAEHVVLKGNDLTLLGVQGSAATTINGSGNGRPLTVSGGEGPDTVIRGLTVTNGRSLEGGGLFVDGASPTLIDVVLSGNHAIETDPDTEFAYGGGAFFQYSQSSLQDVVFRNNSSGYYGGGLSVENSGLRLVRVRFLANSVSGYGGGAAFYFSSVTGDNLMFAGNQSSGGYGGALMAQGGDIELSQVTIVRNASTYGGGAIFATDGVSLKVHNTVFAENAVTMDLDAGGALHLCTDYENMNDMCDPATIDVRFSDVWSNTPVPFFNTPDQIGVNGNIAVAPGFVDLNSPDPAQWDFHLMGGSSLIDAGDPMIKDKNDTLSDIGFYGGPDAL